LVCSHPLFSPKGEVIFLVEMTHNLRREWQALLVTRSLKTGAPLGRSEPLLVVPERTPGSPDGNTPACPTRRATRTHPMARRWSQVPAIHHNNDKQFTGFAFHPSGGYLAATSKDATVKFYDTSTWQLARTFKWDIGRLWSVAFSPDGTLAATGGDTGKVVVWD